MWLRIVERRLSASTCGRFRDYYLQTVKHDQARTTAAWEDGIFIDAETALYSGPPGAIS